MIYLDTHVVIWLYEGLLVKFSKRARQLLEQQDLLISPIVHMEIEYLYEIKRLHQPATVIIEELIEKLGLTTCDAPLMQIVKIANQLNWTRDPFDRLIVAAAKTKEALLLTKDATIILNYTHAFWE